MRNILKSLTLLSVFLIILTFLPSLAHAQSEPGCDPLCNCRADQTLCPIDGNLVLLLVIGVAYGIKRIWNNRKRQISISPNTI